MELLCNVILFDFCLKSVLCMSDWKQNEESLCYLRIKMSVSNKVDIAGVGILERAMWEHSLDITSHM